MNNDLISREALKDLLNEYNKHFTTFTGIQTQIIIDLIDHAPAVRIDTNDIEYKAYCKGLEDGKKIARPQGECVPISKLRLMTVEECAGHTIDYAMGWKACIEWIKKGGAEND